MPALGLAAKPLVNEHEMFTEGPYPANFCGVPGTQVDTVIENGRPLLGAGILSTTARIDIVSGDLLSIDESWHGPHPLRNGVDNCGPAIASLTG